MLVLLAAGCVALGAQAQQQPQRSAEPERSTEPRRRAEPQIKRIVIEDEGARIDELRVRGVTRRITVTPKTGGKVAYEIIPEDPSHDEPFTARSGRTGASGKSVWHVLKF
jgi:hypothetical protein